MNSRFFKNFMFGAGIIASTFVCRTDSQAQCFDLANEWGTSTIQCLNNDMSITETTIESVKTDLFEWIPSNVTEKAHPRHQLITTSGMDNLCPTLKCIPDGENNSILLSNNDYLPTDSLAHGATAVFVINKVETTNPIFVFKYAAAMETPNHPIAKEGITNMEGYAQPWINFYITDGASATKPCEQFTFYAGTAQAEDATWQTFVDTNGKAGIWKDWTTLRFDLSAYAGKKIFIFAEARDCGINGHKPDNEKQYTLCKDHHYARMYCHVSCESLEPAMEQSCTPSNTTLSIPAGYKSYKWYEQSTPATVLSTKDTAVFTTPTTPKTYVCEVTNNCGTITYTRLVEQTQVESHPKKTICGDEFATCQWGNIKWDTISPDLDGIYRATKFEHTQSGCDSIAYLELTVQRILRTSTLDTTINAFHRQDAYIDWKGQRYSEIGKHTYTKIVNYNVAPYCIQEIDTLNLTINLDTCYTEITFNNSICANDSAFTMQFTSKNNTIERYDIAFANAELAAMAGLYNRTNQPFVNDTITYPLYKGSDSLHYARPGVYPFQLITHATCSWDTIYNLAVTINYPAWLIYQRWSDMLSILNENYNGGYSIQAVTWYKNGAVVAGSGEKGGYYNNGTSFAGNEVFYAELTNQDGETLCTCPFTPQTGMTDATKFADEIIVTEENGEAKVQVRHSAPSAYTLYDVNGRVILSGTLSGNYATKTSHTLSTIDLPDNIRKGIYLLTLINENGEKNAKKLMIL